MSSIANQAPAWESTAPRQVCSFGIGAVAAGAVTYGIHIVARSVLTAGVDPASSAEAPLWVPVNALGVVGSVLVLVGLPAIADRMAARIGRAGITGVALIAASWILFGPFLSLYGALVQPWLADEAPHLLTGPAATPTGFVIALALGLLAWLAGAALLARPFLSGRAQPRWVGLALPASAVWFLIGSLVIAPDGPAGNLAVNLLSNAGPLLLLAALGWLGYRSREEPAGGRS